MRVLDRSLTRLPRPLRTLVDWAVTLTLAVVGVLVFQAEVAKPYRIPSASMEPTLHCAPASGCKARFSDRVIANRIVYRFSDPKRGDIVVFRSTLVVGLRHTSPAAAMPGPTQVERRVPNGTIGWLFQHELRGQSLAESNIALGSTVGAHWQPVRFARVLTPDPASKAKIVVSLIGRRGRNICMTVVLPRGGFGGCAIGLNLRPFNGSTAGGVNIAGLVLAGLASDDVARMELFLPQGRHRRVPLQDNAYFVSVRAPTIQQISSPTTRADW